MFTGDYEYERSIMIIPAVKYAALGAADVVWDPTVLHDDRL